VEAGARDLHDGADAAGGGLKFVVLMLLRNE
jgi:hypothetical protein